MWFVRLAWIASLVCTIGAGSRHHLPYDDEMIRIISELVEDFPDIMNELMTAELDDEPGQLSPTPETLVATTTLEPEQPRKRRRRGPLILIPKRTPETVLIQTLLSHGVLCRPEVIQAEIARAFPHHPLIDIPEILEIRRLVLRYIARPVWFHNTLANAPEDLTLDQTIGLIRSQIPSYIAVSDHTLRRSIQVWQEFCIIPLRAWLVDRDGPPPCFKRPVMIGTEQGERMLLNAHTRSAYLEHALMRAQDGLEPL